MELEWVGLIFISFLLVFSLFLVVGDNDTLLVGLSSIDGCNSYILLAVKLHPRCCGW